MSDTIRLRVATSRDARPIQEVARESWHSAYDSILGTETVQKTVRSWFAPERLRADDINPDDRPFFVAEVDERVVGFIEAIPDEGNERTFHLYRIYVTPDYWGQGIGSALLERLESTLKEQDVRQIRLSVIAENDRALRFYQSHGFNRVAERHDEQFDVKRYEYSKGLSFE